MAECQFTPMDHVWNRACDSFSKATLQSGDRALRDLLRAHGNICNGGVFHLFDTLTSKQIEAAKAGYRFFGFDKIPDLLSRARKMIDEIDDIGECEASIDAEYEHIVDDSKLVEQFRQHFAAKPEDFAPLVLPDKSE